MALRMRISNRAYVRISEHSNGYYVQLVYNDGHTAGKIHIYKTEKAAMKKAKEIKDKY